MYVYVYESMPVKIIDPVSTIGLVSKSRRGKTIMVISGKWDQLGSTPPALHVSAHTCSLWRTHLKQAPAVFNVYQIKRTLWHKMCN